MKCADLLSQLTTKRMVFMLLDERSHSIKSMVMSSHTWHGISNDWRSPTCESVTLHLLTNIIGRRVILNHLMHR